MAGTFSKWTHRAKQPEKVAREGPDSCQGSTLRALHIAAHIPAPLGQSGGDAWTLARNAGHSSIRMSERYVHPSQGAVLNAMARLDGHNFEHNEKLSGQRIDCAVHVKPRFQN